MRFLRSGSDEYYKLEEEADNIHRCRARTRLVRLLSCKESFFL